MNLNQFILYKSGDIESEVKEAKRACFILGGQIFPDKKNQRLLPLLFYELRLSMSNLISESLHSKKVLFYLESPSMSYSIPEKQSSKEFPESLLLFQDPKL